MKAFGSKNNFVFCALLMSTLDVESGKRQYQKIPTSAHTVQNATENTWFYLGSCYWWWW